MIKMYTDLRVKYPLFCRALVKHEFSQRSSKNTQISNFMKIHPVGAESFHAEGRTDGQTHRRAEANRSLQFCKEPKNDKALRISGLSLAQSRKLWSCHILHDNTTPRTRQHRESPLMY
jgi:hypothetical protein